MALTWDELAAKTLARQFAAADGASVAEVLAAAGPVQSQAARAPFVGLAARAPWLTHDAISTAYDDAEIVRGSTIRGTVHTATPAQHVVLDAVTRTGQRRPWERILAPQHVRIEEVWAAMEQYADAGWRSVDELGAELRRVLAESGEQHAIARLDSTQGRYLAFGQGALVRRPASGGWSGQGRAEYRSARMVHGLLRPPADDGIAAAVSMHLRAHGPASRYDLAWWSGLGLRQVDGVLDGLELTRHDGPLDRVYVDLPGAPPGRDLPGVRLLPEFDAVLCGYDPNARGRFVTPEHHERLWNRSNGMLAAPLLIDGRVTGHWRLTETGHRRTLQVSWFARTRRPLKSEVAEQAAVLATALDLEISAVEVGRV